MKLDEVILLGVKASVLAISKTDGKIIWSAALASGMGAGFVTVLSDGRHVFAHTHGKLHCLEFATGRVLWTNELSGYGYGLASLCVPGGATAPDAAAVQQIFAEQEQASAGSTGSTHST